MIMVYPTATSTATPAPASPEAFISGTAYGNVNYNETVLESDDTNNISPAFVW